MKNKAQPLITNNGWGCTNSYTYEESFPFYKLMSREES